VRQASALAGVSNTTWGSWENGDRSRAGRVRVGVAKAFGWSTDWVENPPPAPTVTGTITAEQVMARLDELDEKINRLAGLPDAVEELVRSIHDLVLGEIDEEHLQGAGPVVDETRTGSSS
jgi:hypothetical protein